MKLKALARGLVPLALLAGCAGPEPRFFPPEQYPAALSAWGLVVKRGQALALAPGSRVYDLNMALFSDYALKLRTLHLPDGRPASFHPANAFEFPVGTIVTKTFFYETGPNGLALASSWAGDPGAIDLETFELVETRLLVRQEHGWDALPYVWQGDDAYLAITGELQRLPVAGRDAPLPYLVPSRNQCASCHATNHTSGALLPIGLKAAHLNRPAPVSGVNQLVELAAAGELSGLPDLDAVAKSATWADGDLDHRARTYLDINCGHCHNAAGAADTSALLLDFGNHAMPALGVCKPPIAAGRGSGGHHYSIVPGSPETSILTFRMETSDPGAMMPEIGRALVHREGVALIREWIRSLPGSCPRRRRSV